MNKYREATSVRQINDIREKVRKFDTFMSAF